MLNRLAWALARRVTLFLQAVALVILMLYGIMFVQHAVAVIRFPYQMDYGEGVELYAVSRLLSGETLYGSINQPPYHVGVYPPLYNLVVAPVAELAGIQYGAGRAVSAALGTHRQGDCAVRRAGAGAFWPAPGDDRR